MKNFVVMQGHTYKEESELGIIWSPQEDRGKTVPHSWGRMLTVNEGDRIFHCVKGNIVAISVAVSGCRESSKPSNMYSHEQWSDKGYLVDLKYHEIETPLNVRSKFDEILPFLPIKYSPFQQSGNGNQGYLFPCNEELAIKLMEIISDMNIYEFDDNKLDLKNDINESGKQSPLVSIIAVTEAEAKTKVRIGQQIFRNHLLKLWDHKCALCNIKLPELLRASHSIPWKDSTNEERINPFNGILLCCNHDALYDKGFIAFDELGRLHISNSISEKDYMLYNIHKNQQINIYENNLPYFKWHKKNMFK